MAETTKYDKALRELAEEIELLCRNTWIAEKWSPGIESVLRAVLVPTLEAADDVAREIGWGTIEAIAKLKTIMEAIWKK